MQLNVDFLCSFFKFRTKFTYTWSARETTPAGTHLLDLINYVSNTD